MLVIPLFHSLPLFAQVASASSALALTQHRVQLENKLAQQRAAGKNDDDAELKQTVVQLAEVAGKEDDLLQEVPPKAKAAANKTKLNIPVFFVTDRMGGAQAGYSGELRPSGVEYGVAPTHIEVAYTVRADRIAGASDSPNPPSTPRNAFSSSADFFTALRGATSAKPQNRKALVFVHGYRVSFDEAMISAATLASEVGYPVVPVVFSWPSAGSLGGYWHDEDQVRVSYLRLSAFLAQLLQQPGLEVAIVAHSMGARELTSALLDLQRSKTPIPALHGVAYAAGDIFQKEFQDVWSFLSTLNGVGFTSYTSSHDLPLRISHYFHTDPRLGDSSGSPFTLLGVDTIEASGVDPVYQAFGHSYIVKSPRVGADFGAWVGSGLTPEARHLLSVSREGKNYYVFQ